MQLGAVADYIDDDELGLPHIGCRDKLLPVTAPGHCVGGSYGVVSGEVRTHNADARGFDQWSLWHPSIDRDLVIGVDRQQTGARSRPVESDATDRLYVWIRNEGPGSPS
jgi:hypothetical protein